MDEGKGQDMRNPNFERLRGTLQAVRADLGAWNQKRWVSIDKSCGCFIWHAVRLYGTPEQVAAVRWDTNGDRAGGEVLGLSSSRLLTISFAENSLDDIEAIIDQWEASV